MSTVQEILTAVDKLTREELRVVKLGVDSRLSDDDGDPALLASLKEAIAYADTHPDEAKSIDKFARSSFPSSRPAPFSALKAVVGTSLNYCWKLVADEVGQWRVSVVVLGVNPLARKVQHSPSVEQ